MPVERESSTQRRTISLIGFRGCGKTTVGKALAKILSGKIIDTDQWIVARFGKTIVEIFQLQGEAEFRRLEWAAVREALALRPCVLSVGGGAVLDQDVCDRLRAASTIVWLDAPAETLWQRISNDPESRSTRPALTGLSGLAEVEQLLAERRPLYEALADLVIDANAGSPSELAREIATRLNATGMPRSPLHDAATGTSPDAT